MPAKIIISEHFTKNCYTEPTTKQAELPKAFMTYWKTFKYTFIITYNFHQNLIIFTYVKR